MKNKFFIILLVAGLTSYNSFSQTVKENIDKQHKDPSNKEKAARADVYILPKKVTDSNADQKTKQTVVINTKKKKTCFKRKKST